MIFTLEALKARHGDCLMLHYGDPGAPELALIDGGWKTVYGNFLKPRLDQLKEDRAPDGELDIRLLMVSHIDADHMEGVLDLTKGLVAKQEAQQKQPYRIRNIWHNSFNDVVGDDAEQIMVTADDQVKVAGLGGEVPKDIRRQHPGSVVLASVPQGRQLRLDAAKLTIPLNSPDGGLVLAGRRLDLGGVVLTALGPSRQQVAALQKEWDKELKERHLDKQPAEVASFVDDSVFNLSSIVVLAEAESGGERKRILLTGDARGDFLLDAVRDMGLLDAGGKLHVDVFKLPHHGSDNNVDPILFETITADHYVVSGDGNYGNPEVETFRMIFDARAGDDYHVHMTYPAADLVDPKGPYPVAKLQQLFADAQQANPGLQIHTIPAGETSLKVDLLEPFAG